MIYDVRVFQVVCIPVEGVEAPSPEHAIDEALNRLKFEGKFEPPPGTEWTDDITAYTVVAQGQAPAPGQEPDFSEYLDYEHLDRELREKATARIYSYVYERGRPIE